MQKYYRTRVNDIADNDLRLIFDELLLSVGRTPPEQYEMQTWGWLTWFFQQFNPTFITQRNFTPQSALITKLGKLRGTEIFILCREIAAERKEYPLELHENGTLLTYFKKVFGWAYKAHRQNRI